MPEIGGQLGVWQQDIEINMPGRDEMSQQDLKRVFPYIGVARIFSGVVGALFFPEKVGDLFLVVSLNTLVKTTKFTSPTVQIAQISSKHWTLALPGGALSAWGALTTYSL